MKKVTIVIPVYNGANYMREAINSALNQTYKNMEIIVVNDGSTDNTDEIALSYGDKIRYFKKENGGVSTALNLALEKMTGEYFSWCSHDDAYYPDKIEKQMAFLEKQEDKDIIIYNNFALMNEKSEKFRRDVIFNHEELSSNPKLCLIRAHLNGITLLIPKKAFDEFGKFDESLRCTQDYEMWFKMMHKYKFIHMKDVLTKTRIHPLQDTHTSPRVTIEGNQFWIKIIDDKDLIKHFNTPYDYYYELALALKDTPYNDALDYAINKCLEIDKKKYLKNDVMKKKKTFFKRCIESLQRNGVKDSFRKLKRKLKKKNNDEIGRKRKSIYNAITMILNTVITSILSLIATNLIIKNYGSDFNGVVATATQIVNLLLIVEGGFSLAINVALFKPFMDNDKNTINSIMSASKKTFKKIGFIFLIIGIIVSLVYPLFVKSNLDYLVIFLIFLMVIFGAAYNLFFAITPRVMFQVDQKEYIYTIYGIFINILSGITTILLVYNNVNMLFVRLSILIYAIINGIIIYILYKKTFPNINDKVKPDFSKIKGTKDVMIQKVTSVIYTATPLLFISTFISTMMASVYAVYTSIYNIIKMLLLSMVSAPVNGFGQLLSNGDAKKVYPKFKTYEFIVLLISTILTSSVLSVILQFVGIYTKGINDINYVNISIAVMLASILFLEIIHIPAGNIINVTGNFKTSKNIQTLTAVLLVIFLTIGGTLFGIYGILIGTIITNIILAYMEINFVHKKIFESNIKDIALKLILNISIITLFLLYIRNLLPNITSYLSFFLVGILVVILSTVLTFVINFVFFKKDILYIKNLFKKE